MKINIGGIMKFCFSCGYYCAYRTAEHCHHSPITPGVGNYFYSEIVWYIWN